MKKLSLKEIILLVLLIFVVTGALYYNYYFKPYQEEMLELDANIQANKQKLIMLQSQQQAIIEDKAKLNNELLGIEDDLVNIPVGVDEPKMLVFTEDTLTGLAKNSVINFKTDLISNEYFQTSTILISYQTTYPNLKVILDGFRNAPFRNHIVSLNAEYKQAQVLLGPIIIPGNTPIGDEILPVAEENYQYLYVEMEVDCFTLSGIAQGSSYPFMIGPYDNENLFEE